MAQLQHHMYHLHRISMVVINHLNEAIARIPYYVKDQRSLPELLKETRALIEKYETTQAIERIERFVEQVKTERANFYVKPHQADSLLDPAMRLLEQLQAYLEIHGDGQP